MIFGALAVPVIGDAWTPNVLVYAVVSLTVIRMLPVALALAGAGFDRFAVAFIGWFGPLGLASVIFALLAVEDLHDTGKDLVAVIAFTVLLSVLAHGFSGGPLAKRFKESPDRSTHPTEP